MNKKDIIEAISTKKYFKSKSKSYSILLPIIEVEDKFHILYEVRSKDLKHQPSEICFPGGKIEKFESPKAAAIRETEEELNIKKDNISIINSMVPIVMQHNIIINPFIGFVDVNFSNIKYSLDEVESIFSIPIDFLLDNEPEKYEISSKLSIPEYFPFEKIQNGKNYNWRTGKYDIYFYEYENMIVWGLTAKITKEFISILKEYNENKKNESFNI